MAQLDADVDNTRLSTLFGADLGSRLAKLYYDSPPQSPTEGSSPRHPNFPPSAPQSKQASQAALREALGHEQQQQQHLRRNKEPPTAPERAPADSSSSGASTVSARTAALRRISSSGRSTASGEDAAGPGIFAKLRSQSSAPAPLQPPERATSHGNSPPREEINRQQQGSDRETYQRPSSGRRASYTAGAAQEPQRSASPELQRPPSASSSSRREEMAARAAAAARRKQRREQEGSARSQGVADDPAVRSLERELYTIYIDCRAGRRHSGCVVLTRTEFHTFTFKALRSRLAAEQQWGQGDIILQVTDLIGRLRAVQDHELVKGILRHGATVTIDAQGSSRPTSARAPTAPDNLRASGSYPGTPSGQTWSRPPPPAQPMPPRSRPGTAGGAGPGRPEQQRPPTGGYSARASASGSGRRGSGRIPTKDQQGLRQAALWDGWLVTEIQAEASKYSDRQLQVILSQAGVATDAIRRMPRNELVAAVADNVPGWEVARVLACTAAHQILRVSESCSSSDAKASYRKLVVKIHPDKNSDPRASDAMSKATQALKTLSGS